MSKILIDEEVVRQALEALERMKGYGDVFLYRSHEQKPYDQVCDAATTLRQALADASLDKMADNAREMGLSYEQPAQQPTNCRHCGGADNVICAGQCKVQPAPSQEPVAKVCHDLEGHIGWNPDLEQLPDEGTLLYTTQPAQQEPDPDALTAAYMSGVYEGKKRKPWVGLTDEEIAMIHADYPNPQGFAKAIIAKLKEKNT